MMLGPLSPARAGMLELLSKLRSSAPSVADVIEAKTRAAEDRATNAGGIFHAAREAEAGASVALEDLRRKRRHQIDATPRGRQPDQKILDDLDGQIPEAEAELARQRARREDAQSRAQSLRRELDGLRDFVAATPPTAIRLARPPSVPKGATLESIRSEIAQIDAEVERVKAAPLSRVELIRALEAEVDALAARGQPSINVRARDGSPAKLASALALGISPGGNSLIGDPAALWCWLLRDELVARLVELVPDAPGAMTDRERERKLAELADRKLQLERLEETVVEQAEAGGRIVARRPDADVRAVLGIEVKGARS